MPSRRTTRPGRYRVLADMQPVVADAYDQLAEACRQAGPLGEREIALVKVALSIGRGSWRSVHAHVRKALELHVPPEALRHVVFVALPTVGLPAALDALKWVDESLAEQEAARRKKPAPRRSRSGDH